MPARTVDVSICGQTYRVRGEADDAYVRAVAQYVDQKMREIGDGRGAESPLRTAVLAAFNIADEMFQTRKAAEERNRRAERKRTEIAALLDGAER